MTGTKGQVEGFVSNALSALLLGVRWAATTKNLILLLVAAIVVDWAITGIRVVREDEQAVVLRFGAVTRVAPAGILFTLPWPLERSITVKTSEVRTMPVGYKLVDSVRGIPPNPKEVEWVTGDTNIINLKLTLKYSVYDPVKYLFSVGPIDTDFLLRRCAEENVTKLIATMPVDEVLTSGKFRIQEETRQRTQAMLDYLDTGIRLITVNLGGVEPPSNVIEAFNDVSTAKTEKAKMLNQADGYQKDLIPRARAMANRMIQEAESYHAATVEGARGKAAQFTKLLEQARLARGITQTRLYLEAMERILPRTRKIIVEDKEGEKIRLLE
ncbi:MAG: FtsH protease activity modulator HflK [Candidatus Eisenbacteria sp.]|nr:FtsH protease activity modulator HflK [Candidatus Eisenbacteria bacterium]